jgi:hypothetical protein
MKRFVACLASVAFTIPCIAQPDAAQVIAERFAAADTNHDGKLTQSEAATGMPRVAQYFAQIDRGNKGYVTITDIEAFFAQHQAKQ